ncbi:unnamed protein product [Chilo suppressalis]|uniref:Uncharacterized protein n=1 Tax=Chilo suppressalis TaxID=168631 RepID=A0ABN8ATJ8_CHISP|nr:unnamed protein product [Chilo suppressalis]
MREQFRNELLLSRGSDLRLRPAGGRAHGPPNVTVTHFQHAKDARQCVGAAETLAGAAAASGEVSGRERDDWCPHEARRHALTCARRCACCGAARCPDMEESGYWRPSCSTLSLAEPHGSTTHLCARHAPPRPHRHPHAAHAHALAHQHQHAHAHHLSHAQHASCPVHSPFRQPTPEYCAAHSQVTGSFNICWPYRLTPRSPKNTRDT